MTRNLNDRQIAFLDDFYANTAEPRHLVYQRHYRAGGKAAKVNVSRLLAKPEAQAYLEGKRQAAAERNSITEDQIVQRLWELADYDILDILNEHGDIKPINEIPRAARQAITSITPTNSGMFRLTFANRMVALDRIVDMLNFGVKTQEGSETSMLQELFSFVQKNGRTGEPGAVQFDTMLAAQSLFDADG